MADWLKILVSALAGMVTAGALEPLKHWINRRIAAREIQTAIYAELARVYVMFDEEVSQDGVDAVMRRIIMETYDFYFHEKREIFHLVPNYLIIIGIYGKLKDLRESYRKGEIKGELEVKDFIRFIDIFIITGAINNRRFERELKKAAQWKGSLGKQGDKSI